MAVDLTNSEPIDESNPDIQRWLEKLQGNILRGHGRDFGLYIFFSFGSDVGRARSLLKFLGTYYVTSATQQYSDTLRYREALVPGPLFGNLFLTASGYRRLDLAPDPVFKEPGEEERRRTHPVSTFLGGMRETAELDFADPPVDRWESGYRQSLDAMLLLADDDESRLLDRAFHALSHVRPDHTVHVVEAGRAIRNADGQGVDHFGFADGLSQPLYLASDFRMNTHGQRTDTKNGHPIDQWDPFEPLGRALLRDPFGPDDDCLGSYLVFRKLEQDVRGFRTRELELARELGLDGDATARAGALVVGRFRDGTPVTLSHTDGRHPVGDNNFTYAQDRRGRRCPFHAHVRKVNPRGDAAADVHERERRITRRSITYGSSKPYPVAAERMDALPSAGVGLLFMCFQASIRRQFAFAQRTWCSETDFPSGAVGIDPMVGHAPHAAVVPQWWSSCYNRPADRRSGFGGFVTMKGGELFFAPSIPFLRAL